MGGEVVNLGYPVFRERLLVAVEDPPAELSEPFTILALTSGETLDALLEDFCAEI